MEKKNINPFNKLRADNSTVPSDNNTKKIHRDRKFKIPKKAIAIVAILVVGLVIYKTRSSRASSSASETVNTAVASIQNLESSLSSSGTLQAKDTYSITSLVSGTIISADFEEGDQVEEGQILYQIDVSSMQSEVTSATNSLTRAQESLEEAQDDYNEALSNYSGRIYRATQSGYITKLYIVDGQKISNGNIADLYDDTTMELRVPFLSGMTSYMNVGDAATVILSDTLEEIAGTVVSVGDQEEVLSGGRLVKYVIIEVANPGGLTTSTSAKAIVSEFTSAAEATFTAVTESSMQADLKQSVEIVDVLVHVGDYVTKGTPLFTMTSDSYNSLIKQYKNSVDTAQDQVESAQQKLDSTTDTYENYTITAPISGQVIRKTYKAGDKISSGSSTQALAIIYDLSEYKFEMSIDENDISSLKVGQTVEVQADAFSGQTFTGKVTSISLESTSASGVSTYPVTVTLDETGDLLPGMNVDGNIIIASASNALCVPASALQRGNMVYVQDATVTTSDNPSVPDGFRAVEVTTGLINDSYVQILSGISEGDVVYVPSSTTTNDQMMNMNFGGDFGGGGAPGGDFGGGGGNPGGGRGGPN